MGEDIASALENAYAKAAEVCWDGVYYRKDIGQDILNLIK
jgi:phosphoribosylamine--glycine ligase